MSKKNINKKIMLTALALTIGSAAQASVVNNAVRDPLFSLKEVGSQSLLIAHAEGKCGEGKCGEGKKEATTKAKSVEGKCGEGKCGGKKGKQAAKKATTKATTKAKGAEGKCGEGKCGTGKEEKKN